jgi:hypothetical protein
MEAADSPARQEKAHERLLMGLKPWFWYPALAEKQLDANRPGSNSCLLLQALVSSIVANTVIKELSIFYKCGHLLKRQLINHAGQDLGGPDITRQDLILLSPLLSRSLD